MISKMQFVAQALTAKKQAMPESKKFDGPSPLEFANSGNNAAANSNAPLAGSGTNA